jgi:hypothetical protein
MPSVSWIYYLRKAQLELQLRELRMETTGTVEQLRERLISYVREHPEEFQADIPVAREDIYSGIKPSHTL